MTTILACDVLPDMVIRTMFESDRKAGTMASATFRVASVDRHDGVVYIHADSRSSQIFEIPDHVQVQVLQWPSYAHEEVLTAPGVVESWDKDPELEADNEALLKAMAEDDGTRIPFDKGLMVRLANTGVPLGEVRRYFQDAAAKTAFKLGGVL